MPHVVRCGSHHRIDGVPKGSLEVVPYHPVIGLQVADNRLDSRTLAELLPIKLRIRRERDVLLRYLRRIHHQADFEDLLSAFLTDTLTKLCHVYRIHRRTLLEHLLTREVQHARMGTLGRPLSAQ